MAKNTGGRKPVERMARPPAGPLRDFMVLLDDFYERVTDLALNSTSPEDFSPGEISLVERFRYAEKNECCGGCAYFLFSMKDRGNCRRYPPEYVSIDDWCREYKPCSQDERISFVGDEDDESEVAKAAVGREEKEDD